MLISVGTAAVAGLAVFAVGSLASGSAGPDVRGTDYWGTLAAGIFLAGGALDLLPEAIKQAPSAGITALLILIVTGLLFLHSKNHAHVHEGTPHAYPRSRLGALAIAVLLFHRVADGLVIAAGFQTASSAGYAVSAGMLLHQVPDGLALGTMLGTRGWRRQHIRMLLGTAALTTPAAAWVGGYSAGLPVVLPHLLAASAAILLVAGCEGLMHAFRSRDPWRSIPALVMGLIVVVVAGLSV